MVDPEPETTPAPPQTAPAGSESVSPSHPRRIALAHDWLVNDRGGEAVLAHIADAALERGSPGYLYTLFDGHGPYANAIDRFPTRASPLNRLPDAARRWLLPAYPRAVESLGRALARDHAREPIDLLISTSSGLIKGLRPPPGVPHLCYCHAPARYLWSATDQYTRGAAGRVRAAGFALFGPSLRAWDARTASRVSRFVANSSYIRDRVREHFGRDAEVVHPPVRTDRFTPDPTVPREDFWLCFGAHEPYKRTDLAIDAAVRSGTRLVIAGGGSALPSLRRHAARAPSGLVEFRGRVSNDELIDLYRRARCLIFPQVEDFGIVAVEAQACGCPVVARGAGGALDSVIDGETGAFFEGERPDAIVRAAATVTDRMGPACRANAERFAADRFARDMRRLIDKTLREPDA
jgi:glycosyltransferase involved in cell wall biosynthesis